MFRRLAGVLALLITLLTVQLPSSPAAGAEDEAPALVMRYPGNAPPADTLFGSTVVLDGGFLYATAPGWKLVRYGKVFKSMWMGWWTDPEALYFESLGFNDGRAFAARHGEFTVSGRDYRSALFGDIAGLTIFEGGPSNDFRGGRLFSESVGVGNNLGATLALSDTYVASAAIPNGGFTAGWVVVHEITGTKQVLTAGGEGQPRITEPVEDISSGFGSTLAMTDDVLVIGAPNKNDGAGTVYVYTRQGTTWSMTQRMDGVGRFGSSIALVGGTLVVGAPQAAGGAGRTHVYTLAGGQFGNMVTLTAGDQQPFDQFGQAVALSSNGTSLAVGAPNRDSRGVANAGGAYLFVLADGVWSQQRVMSRSEAVVNDQLGLSVAVEGSTVVVGAPLANYVSPEITVEDTGLVAVFGSPTADMKVPVVNVLPPGDGVEGDSFEFQPQLQSGTPTSYYGYAGVYDQNFVLQKFPVDPATGVASGKWPTKGPAVYTVFAVNANGWTGDNEWFKVNAKPVPKPPAPTGGTPGGGVTQPGGGTPGGGGSTPGGGAAPGAGGGSAGNGGTTTGGPMPGTTVSSVPSSALLSTNSSVGTRDVARYARVTVPKSATLSITVSGTSRNVCRYSAGRLKGIDVGTCDSTLVIRTRVKGRTTVRRVPVSIQVSRPSSGLAYSPLPGRW